MLNINKTTLVYISILILNYLKPWAAFGQGDLPQAALFSRCYGQLTQSIPSKNHPSLVAVTNGSLDPIEGCLAILKKAVLTAQNGERLPEPVDSEAQSILSNFHNLHGSWFYSRFFPNITIGATGNLINDLLDPSQPALYITRALFSPNVRADSIVRLNFSLRPIRTTAAPSTGAFSNATPASLGFAATVPLAPTGALLGVARGPSSVVATVNGVAGADIGTHYGGGFLGDQAYLRLNLQATRTFKANGAENLPREWSRAVFHDVLCRDIPVIRVSDAQKFVAPSSNVPFRTSAGCNVCHASIDRLGMSIRGIKYATTAVDAVVFSPPTGNPLFFTETGTNLILPSWPTAPNSSFDITRPSGVLYLRDISGKLLQIPIGDPTSITLTVNDSLDSLGAEFSKLDDLYVCLAKRYYQYFTGVNVDLTDPSSPDEPRVLTNQDQYHLNKVISLGQELKTSQSILTMIEQIVKSLDYRKSNYGH